MKSTLLGGRTSASHSVLGPLNFSFLDEDQKHDLRTINISQTETKAALALASSGVLLNNDISVRIARSLDKQID